MLEAIFGSGTRVKIINFLLLSAEKKYQLSSLTKQLNIPTAPLRRELDNLVKFGLIKEEKNITETNSKSQTANQKIYSANSDFILYPEIKSLFAKAQILFGQKFITNLQKACPTKFLALTGIFTNDANARTDILIVGHLKKPVFLKLISELESELGREINFTILSEQEFKYRETVMDIFLYSILDGKTLILLDTLHAPTNSIKTS
jgi:hypothetical protein